MRQFHVLLFVCFAAIVAAWSKVSVEIHVQSFCCFGP